jgi:hypothetical protein
LIKVGDSSKLFLFELYYGPSDIYYHDNNQEFWTDWSEYYLARTEEVIAKEKVTAYNIAKERANQYAKELGTQLKFRVSTDDSEFYYISNEYLTKKYG